jgi:hypothetical protein
MGVYNPPSSSSISVNTTGLGKQSKGVYEDLFFSTSQLTESKTIQRTGRKMAQPNQQVQFFDEKGDAIVMKPHLIDYINFENLTYLIYSSEPIDNDRFKLIHSYQTESTHMVFKLILEDYQNDANDIYSYYLINHQTGKVFDMKEELRKFDDYFRDLNGFVAMPLDSSTSYTTSGGGIIPGKCGLLPFPSQMLLLKNGFIAEVICQSPENAFIPLGHNGKVRFTFNEVDEKFEYTFVEAGEIWFNYISPIGVGFGVINTPNHPVYSEGTLIKFDFNSNTLSTFNDIAFYFNEEIYQDENGPNIQWFRASFLARPILIDHEYIYYPNIHNLAKFDFNLNFVSYEKNDVQNYFNYNTLKQEIEGYYLRSLFTLGEYAVKLFTYNSIRLNQGSTKMILINRKTKEVSSSNEIPQIVNWFQLVGSDIIGLPELSITPIEEMILLKWSFEQNEWSVIYHFELVSEEQLQSQFSNLMPMPENEIALTGYAKVLKKTTTNTVLNYEIISLITGKIYSLNETKPIQSFNTSIVI